MINGKCIVASNYKDEEFPTLFVEVPKKGSYVESKNDLELRVVKIVHCVKQEENLPYYKPFPFIKIYLL